MSQIYTKVTQPTPQDETTLNHTTDVNGMHFV